MRKNILITCTLLLLCFNLSYSQSNLYPRYYLFNEIGIFLNNDYDSIVKSNKEGNWLSEKELQEMKSLINERYVPMVYLYEILVDLGRPELDENFDIVFFTFYNHGSPTYPWAFIVYKHSIFDIYYHVFFDILNNNERGFGEIIHCWYEDKINTNLDLYASFDEDYENYIEVLNFSGIAFWFKSEKIVRAKFLHAGSDFAGLINLEYDIRYK
nr:hypothetical protein [Saprospiraceae bacterium]